MTISRPTTVPEWASGASRRVEPDSGEKANGFVQAMRSAARKANWALGLASDWTQLFAAIVDSNEEHTYQVAKARSVAIPGMKIVNGSTSGAWLCDEGGGAVCAQNGKFGNLNISDELRTGCELTGVSVKGSTTTASAAGLRFKIFKRALDGTATQIGATWNSTTSSGAFTANAAAFTAEVVDRATDTYFLEILSSSAAATAPPGDRIYTVSIAFNDIGPRNG